MIASRSAFSPDHRDYSWIPRDGVLDYIGCISRFGCVGGEYSVHVAVLPSNNFIGGTLSLCIFMPWMLLPAFARVYVWVRRNAYFTWRTTEIRVDAEMRSIDAKCSHFSQSFLRVSRYYEPASFLSRRVSAPNVIQK